MMRGEYYVLALTALLGIFVMVSANSLLTVYIGVELMSLSLYAMVAFDRENGVAAESAMKYFVLGAIASGMLLYGMSLIYGMTGTLMLDDLSAMATGEPSLGVVLGLVFLVVAVAFKFGAVPFHMWVPDVYTGAPTAVTLFLSTVPKIASFALAFRLLAHGLGSVGATWQDMLDAARGAVDGVRQRRRHRADQSQAHARVFGHRQRRLHPARFRRRLRSRIRSRAVLHHRLRDHDARLVRRARAREPPGLRSRRPRSLQGPAQARSAAGAA